MQRIILGLLLTTLTGCAANHVSRLDGEGTTIKHSTREGQQQRFTNLFTGKHDYPVTCSADCYPPHPQVVCEQPAENCQYTGPQRPAISDSGFTVRWLGHASFLIQTANNTSLLLDPVSDQFDWPVDWAFRLSDGFFRNPPAWPNDKELQQVDAVLYSHVHYDHFNKADINALGTQPHYLVPLNFAEHFPSGGYHITEMAWFANTPLNDLTIHFVPANHFSSRIWVPYLYEDQNKTLWGGWIIEQGGKRLFFAGDTGYSPHFKQIQQRYGDMDVCLLPIASYYHPQDGDWYRYVHTTPEDALIAAQELGCKVMIPWGYGNASWKMGDISSHSPLLRLLHMQQEMNATTPLLILNEGDEVAL